MALTACDGGTDLAARLRITVDDDLPATANEVGPANANNSPDLAVDPTNSLFVVMAHRLDAAVFGCALQVSGDGGRGFVGASPVSNLPAGVEKCYAPEVEFDERGVLYYLFVGLHGRGNTVVGVYLTTSTDRGRSFSEPRHILGANNFGVRMAINRYGDKRGRIHLVWLASNADPSVNSLPTPPNPIVTAYSDDRGASFTPPVQVSDPGRALVVAPTLALGLDDRVVVSYYDLRNDVRDYHGLEGPTWEEPWSVIVVSSSDGGRTFGRSHIVDDTVVPPERVLLIFTMPPPSVAIAGDGRIVVAWHDARNGDWDAFIRTSGDDGRTWSGINRLNDDPVNNGRHQYQPRLAVAPNGRVDAVFYDRRDDGANLRNDVFFAYSADGGASFSRNVKLTSKASSSRTGPRYVGTPLGLIEYGSRLGLLSRDDSSVAAWTDTRNAPLPDYQDIFVTTVRFEH
ncbi:MAG: sialidase family protein [Mycobacterium sp.]